MSSFVSTLARRSIDLAHSTVTKGGDGDTIDVQIPPAALLLLLLTIAGFTAILFVCNYSVGHVITTLCMIESPETDTFVPVHNISSSSSADPPAYSAVPQDSSNKPDDDQPNFEVVVEEPDMLVIRKTPVTASIRATIRHLRSYGGLRSLFRGISIYMIWHFARNFIVGLLGVGMEMGRYTVGVAITTIIAETLLSRFHLAWIHIVISTPSPLPWYRRMPNLNTSWVKIAPCVALVAVTKQISRGLPLLIANSFGTLKKLSKHSNDADFNPTHADLYKALGQMSMVVILACGLFVLLEIPATVTLVRVAASMLPDEFETIVPFDRSFGGKVTPAIVGGSGKIGMLEAWRSYPRASRVRLLRLFGMLVTLVVMTWFVFVAVIVTEAHLVFGDKLGEIMKSVHRQLRQH